jgi:crotonobetainyl-CoA:carnitine CoA-transferase CaiB-like acyl-CoA transferase
LEAVGLPVGRLLDFAAVGADPQVSHNEMIVETTHPRAGAVRMVGSPLRVDGSPARAAAAPPVLGQDTRQVLADLGADETIIDRLVAAGSVVVA